MPEEMQTQIVSLGAAPLSQASDARLRPLLRLGQLADEMERAVQRQDMGVLEQAAKLLAPTLAQWTETASGLDIHDPEVTRLTGEARQALADCETCLSQAMASVQKQRGQLRQQQQRVRQARPPSAAPAGRALNISP